MTNARTQPRLRRGRALRVTAPLAALSALALTAPAPASAATCSGANADPATTNMKTVKHATICLLNQQRRKHGLKKLKTNGRLSLASQRHSNGMVASKTFAHGNFVGRIKAARYIGGSGSWTVGEENAWGSGRPAHPGRDLR